MKDFNMFFDLNCDFKVPINSLIQSDINQLIINRIRGEIKKMDIQD